MNRHDEVGKEEVEEMMVEEELLEELKRAKEEYEEYRKKVEEAKVPIWGSIATEAKEDSAIRFLSANLNGLAYWLRHNHKADRLKFLMERLKIDVVGLQEVCVNWSVFKASQNIGALLRRGDEPIRSVASHNRLEQTNAGRAQRGGTATIVHDLIAPFVKNSNVDHTKLGRWSWCLIEGEGGHRTRIVTAYSPVKTNSPGLRTTVQQQWRYIRRKGLKTNPRQMFIDDLANLLRLWRGQGDRLVLMMDANDHVLTGETSRRLAEEGIDLEEAVHSYNGGVGPNTYFRGKDPIDGIWVTPDLTVCGAAYLPYDPCLGDHRPVMVDISTRSTLGNDLPRIVPHKARRLTSKVARIRQAYIDDVERKFKAHGVYEKLKKIEARASCPASAEVTVALQSIDDVIVRIMKSAEKRCRKFRMGTYEFSPAIKALMDRVWALRSLEGHLVNRHRKGNVANIHRFCWRTCGIPNSKVLTLAEVKAMLILAKEELKRHLAESPWMRKHFLHERLKEAVAKEHEEEVRRIKNSLRSEAQRKAWRGVQRTTKPGAKSRAMTRIEEPLVGGDVKVVDTKEGMEDSASRFFMDRFSAADSADVCNGALFELLGYSANTETAVEILEGRFVPPADTPASTRLILEEVGRIWAKMGTSEVDIVVTREDFQYYWRRKKERTSSSYSKVHIGHYASCAHSDFLSEVLAKKLTLITSTGATPERWASGLTVILEKVAGIALITKMRAILLMEADFNFHNSLIFGKRMLDLARDMGMVPDELFQDKGRTSEDALLQQVLVHDLARQWRRPLLVASVDASQCYDRIAHCVAALTLRAFKVRNSSVLTMLTPIQEMQFYLRTGFGESKTPFGGKEHVKQGACQGNGGAPPTWQQISTMMMNVQRRQGHGIVIEAPLSKKRIRQVGIAFVDDANLFEGLAPDDDRESVLAKGQEAINTYGGSLISTGGNLKPEKCNYTIHDVVPNAKGEWVYNDVGVVDHGDDELDDMPPFEDDERITVPQANGDAAAIKKLRSDECVKYLGHHKSVDGSSAGQLGEMRNRVEEWTTNVKDGTLPVRSVWMSYNYQLWSGMRYGLGTLSASIKELQEGLGKSDYHLISSLGVVRTIQREWRYMPSTFGGMGLFSLPLEATISSLNLLLQHYQTSGALGTTITTALENLQVELGVQDCPLKYDYEIWSGLATTSWIKDIWERVWHYKIELHLDYKKLELPRKRDFCIMEAMVESGMRGTELAGANRARKAQQSMFASCIGTADGRKVQDDLRRDWREGVERQLGHTRSTIPFGKEVPTSDDWRAWQRGLDRITAGNNLFFDKLGDWVAASPRIWHAYVSEDGTQVQLKSPRGRVKYQQARGIKESVRYYEPIGDVGEHEGHLTIPAQVEDRDRDYIRLMHVGPQQVGPSSPPRAQTLQAHLHSFGGEWMWRDLNLGHDTQWLADAMRRNTLVCVADGSHMPNTDYTDVCSAGWVIQDTLTGRFFEGGFAERSASASSYRGEQLGLLAIYTILLAVEEYHGVEMNNNRLYSDCKGALTTFKRASKRVPSSSKNADIQRALRSVRSRVKGTVLVRHVRAHQDRYARRSRLALEAQLNCQCDDLAKLKLREWVLERRVGEGTLPLEHAAVYIDMCKQTSDIGPGLRLSVGRREAKTLYAKKEMLDEESFELVAWDSLTTALSKKPKMYQQWLAKQTSGYCGVGSRIKYFGKGHCHKCPSCGDPNEDANHLMRCKDKTRREVLQRSVDELESWMRQNKTHPDLVASIPTYILGRGNVCLSRMRHRSAVMRKAAADQDRIGWRLFTEGKVAISIRNMQDYYLLQHGGRPTINTWMCGFISKILEVTHTQWICRNITKHHHTKGSAIRSAKEHALREIEKNLDKGIDSLAPECQCLLEIPEDELQGMPLEDQTLWLYAFEAGEAARAHASKLSEGREVSWDNIIRHGKFVGAPTMNPVFEGPLDKLLPPAPPKRKKQRNDAVGRRPAAPTQTNTSNATLPTNGTKAVRKARKAATRAKSRTTTSSGRRGARGQTVASPRAVAADRLSLLSPQPVPAARRHTLDRLLAPNVEQAILRPGANSISTTSFARLRPGEWLDDEVITYVCRRVLQPEEGVCYIMPTHFMSSLLRVGHSSPGYSYEDVSGWSRRAGCCLMELQRLIVPIHKGNDHWLFLVVLPEQHRIELYDSLGRHANNSTYMAAMVRYLWDDCRAEEGSIEYDAWAQLWTCQDMSRSGPRQRNGYDCGVFTIIGIALALEGVPLTSETFTQDVVDHANSRERIANAILDSIPAEATTLANWLLQPSAAGRTATATAGGRRRNKRAGHRPSPSVQPHAGGQAIATGRKAKRRRLCHGASTPGAASTRVSRKRKPATEGPLDRFLSEERLTPRPRKRAQTSTITTTQRRSLTRN